MRHKLFNFRAVPAALIFLIIGITVGAILPPICGYIFLSVAAIFAIALFVPKLSGFLLRDNIRKRRLIAAYLCAFFVIGVCAAFISNAVVQGRYVDANDVTITARVSGESYHGTDGSADAERVFAEDVVFNGKKLSGKTELSGLSEAWKEEIRVGDVFELRGNIRSRYFDVSDSFDMSYYQNKNYYIFYVKEAEFLENNGRKLDEAVCDAARALLERNADPDTAAFVYSMLFGDKFYLDSQIKNDFRLIGAAHIFAVSGLHVGILAAAILFVLKKCRAGKITRTVIVAAVLAFYAYLCGFSASIIRASLMILIAMLARIVGARNDGVSTISLSAIIMLLANPYSLFSISFMMSYLAVFSLAFFAAPMTAAFGRKMPKIAAAALAANISVNIGLLPVTVYYFSSLSLLAIPANLIIIPFMSVMFPLLFPALLLGATPFTGWIITGATYPFKLIVMFGEAISKVPFLRVSMGFEWYNAFVYFALLLLVSRFSLFKPYVKRVLAGVLVVWIGTSAASSLSELALPKGSVSAFYVEYSRTDVALIKEKDGANVVINGPINSEAVFRLNQLAEKLSIHEINALITHEIDEDESKLLQDNFRNLPVRVAVALSVADLNEKLDVLWQTDFIADDCAAQIISDGAIGYYNSSCSLLFLNGGAESVTDGVGSYDLVFSDALTYESEVKHLVKYGELDDKRNNGFTINFKNGKINYIKFLKAE